MLLDPLTADCAAMTEKKLDMATVSISILISFGCLKILHFP